jgi:leader peptidase (prepilin peptidase)/N-methyltransferase
LDDTAAQLLRPFAIAWAAVLGAAIGSFLNVVVARLPHGRSVVRPGSRCPRCQAPIAWYDNVPVLSWLLLRARCRACRAPISPRYPLVELLVGGFGAWSVARHGVSAGALAEFLFAATLVALAFIDLDTWLLPFVLTVPLSLLGLVAGALGLAPSRTIQGALTGGALGFGAFLAVHLVGERVFKKEALGFGDVVLLGALGAFLGPRALLPVILLSSLQGAVVGIVLLLVGRGEPGPEAGPADPLAADGSTPDAPPASTPGGGEREVAPGGGARPPRQAHPLEEDAAVEPDDWIPPRHAIPYGPFLALAALQWLYLAGPLSRLVPALSVFLPR